MLYIIKNILLILIFLSTDFLYAQDSIKIKKHLHYLGSDLFEGRGTGTIGGELSAKYIALNLNKYKILPMGYEDSYYQYIPMHGTKPTCKSHIIILNSDGADTLSLNKNFLINHISGRIFTPNPIPVVFVGYGIVANEYNYDDYKNIDVEGKVVIFLEGEPQSDLPDYFKGEYKTIYSYPDTKQKIAISKGAVGSIQIPYSISKTNANWNNLISEYNFEDISLAYLPTPVLNILFNPDATARLFKNSKYSYKDVLEMCKENKLKSFQLSNKLFFKLDFVRRDFMASNIVGYLKGSDEKLKNEYIVVSAHYDHLGIGNPIKGDSIYNGVLDNAIGVSALLELSRLFGENDQTIKRSIIFVFTTGEEKGLLGSTYFIQHPPVEKDKIIANINIDGLAVFGKFKSIIGIGADFSTLKDILVLTAKKSGFILEELPNQFDAFESFLRSDQLAFSLSGIPSILISDGFIYNNFTKAQIIKKWNDYMTKKYHTPFDDLHQEINIQASIRHIKFLYNFIKELSNTNIIIKWNKYSPFLKKKL